jgi:hypothetical protein
LGVSEFAADGLEVPGGVVFEGTVMGCCALLEGTVTGGAVTSTHPASAAIIKSTTSSFFITHPLLFALSELINITLGGI